jgi:cysteine synthase A
VSAMMQAIAALGLPAPLETPLIKSGNVWVKPELWQWTYSVKYRMVYAKVQRALQEGSIGANTVLVEVTSGSTGAALAFVGQRLGVPVEIHAFASITPKKRALIEDAGGNLVLHPPTVPVADLLKKVKAKVNAGGYWHLGQFDRQSTMVAYEGLGKELVAQLNQQEVIPRTFICPVGTGGLIQGLGVFLRKAFPGILVVAIEPQATAEIEGTRNTEVCHLGENDPYDPGFPDRVIRVGHPEKALNIGDIPLGESASAAYALACLEEGTTVVVAPD